MKNILRKELKLCASLLTYFFLAFTLMAFIPGYPILVGAFFVSFGIFQSFQNGRESNDILYTTLLPIRKRDAVTAKYIFSIFFELSAFVLMAIWTVLRMTVLADVEPYVSNVMMPANPVFLAYALIIFAMFNCIFVNKFFDTAYNVSKPFILFIIVAFLIIGASEALHHFPFLPFLAGRTSSDLAIQFIILGVAAVLYILITAASIKSSQNKFEKIDL